MATINFNSLAGIVKMTVSNDPLQPDQVFYKNKASTIVEIEMKSGFDGMGLRVGGTNVWVENVTSVAFEGVGAVDLVDFDAKMAILFPNVGSGTTTTLFGDDITMLVDPAYYDILPGHMLRELLINPSEDAVVSIGNAEGDDGILSGAVETVEDPKMITLNLFAISGRRIYFTGIPTLSTVYLITKNVII